MPEAEKHGPRKNKKKVMNMEASVTIRSNGTAIDWHELDDSIFGRVQALIHARDVVGFANSLEEDQSHAPLEVTMDLSGVPLATINDPLDAFQLKGLDDMTAVNYNDAMYKVQETLAEAAGNDSELLKAIKDCSMGQLFLIVKEIKETVDGDADQKE